MISQASWLRTISSMLRMSTLPCNGQRLTSCTEKNNIFAKSLSTGGSERTPRRKNDEDASNDDSTSELDGDVTLTTQATFATNFLEQVVNSNKGSNQPSEIEKSLDALRKVLTARNANNGDPGLVDTQRILSPTGQGGYQLPPMHLAMMAIQKLRGGSFQS